MYVAYGPSARRETTYGLDALRRWYDGPVTVVSDEPLPGARYVTSARIDKGARWQKLNLDTLSPYVYTLYLDADTRVQGDIRPAFGLLADGWDVVITASENQQGHWLWHVGEADREATRAAIGFDGLQLQAGVLGVAWNARTRALWQAWREEWQRFQNQDQGAFLRALYRNPVRLWLLGRDWNGGALIAHRFGMARG